MEVERFQSMCTLAMTKPHVHIWPFCPCARFTRELPMLSTRKHSEHWDEDRNTCTHTLMMKLLNRTCIIVHSCIVNTDRSGIMYSLNLHSILYMQIIQHKGLYVNKQTFSLVCFVRTMGLIQIVITRKCVETCLPSHNAFSLSFFYCFKVFE